MGSTHSRKGWQWKSLFTQQKYLETALRGWSISSVMKTRASYTLEIFKKYFHFFNILIISAFIIYFIIYFIMFYLHFYHFLYHFLFSCFFIFAFLFSFFICFFICTFMCFSFVFYFVFHSVFHFFHFNCVFLQFSFHLKVFPILLQPFVSFDVLLIPILLRALLFLH